MKYETSAKQNIALLPEYCYGVLLTNKSLIRIKSGEMGYFPLNLAATQDILHLYAGKATNEIADILNAEMGITKNIREAMEFGSQFGYSLPLANPNNYTENGYIIEELMCA